MYIFWFLHQTTTRWMYSLKISQLYIFWFLHQTTTLVLCPQPTPLLYIFWFLHQTTTDVLVDNNNLRCISFDSYIKPQRLCYSSTYWCVVYLLIPTSNHNFMANTLAKTQVVYLLIPTSNHNLESGFEISSELYIFWFLHQTTTSLYIEATAFRLYIFWFLHQTTTTQHRATSLRCCISFDSYIKPQLWCRGV